MEALLSQDFPLGENATKTVRGAPSTLLRRTLSSYECSTLTGAV